MDWIKKIFNKTKYYVWYIFWYTVYWILGAIIALYPIYNRLILEKLPPELPLNLISKGHYVTVAIFLCVLFIWIYIIYKSCKPFVYNYLKIDYVPSKLILKIEDLIKTSIGVFYGSLENNIPFTTKFYVKIMNPLVVFLRNWLYTRYRMRWAIYITFILPHIIIMMAFFIDAVILHEMCCSYKIWVIYIIVFIERYIIYWTSLFKRNNLKELQKTTALYYVPDKSLLNTLKYYYDSRDCEYEKSINDEHYIINHDFPLNIENSLYLVLDANWVEDARDNDPDFNYVATRKRFRHRIRSYIFPIALFNEFYEDLRNDIRSKFLIFQSLFYVSLWTYIIIYIW